MKTRLCFIKNNVVVAEMPTTLSENESIELDEMLRKMGALKEDEEVAIVDYQE